LNNIYSFFKKFHNADIWQKAFIYWRKTGENIDERDKYIGAKNSKLKKNKRRAI
tara:strand:+ start:1119 stop:1280 length:162 start_codon:yes stop_codon:yes gene_type:complete